MACSYVERDRMVIGKKVISIEMLTLCNVPLRCTMKKIRKENSMENNISLGWTICIAALPAVIAAFVSIWVALSTRGLTKRIHDEDIANKKNEKLVADIKRKLEDFYYPFLLFAKENKSLYEVFSQEHIARNNDFRTLPALLNNEHFSNNDKAILERIIDNDVKLRDLINSNAHAIEDYELREGLVKAATHYAIIELAFNNIISGEVDRFKPYVHPNDIYEKVEKKTRELEKVIQDVQ